MGLQRQREVGCLSSYRAKSSQSRYHAARSLRLRSGKILDETANPARTILLPMLQLPLLLPLQQLLLLLLLLLLLPLPLLILLLLLYNSIERPILVIMTTSNAATIANYYTLNCEYVLCTCVGPTLAVSRWEGDIRSHYGPGSSSWCGQCYQMRGPI